MKKEVVCVTCFKSVTVTIRPFDGGYIAIFPDCGKLAYNSNDE